MFPVMSILLWMFNTLNVCFRPERGTSTEHWLTILVDLFQYECTLSLSSRYRMVCSCMTAPLTLVRLTQLFLLQYQSIFSTSLGCPSIVTLILEALFPALIRCSMFLVVPLLCVLLCEPACRLRFCPMSILLVLTFQYVLSTLSCNVIFYSLILYSIGLSTVGTLEPVSVRDSFFYTHMVGRSLPLVIIPG